MNTRRLSLALILLVAFLLPARLPAQELPAPMQIMERYIQVCGDYSGLANTRIELKSDTFNGLAMDVELVKDSANRMRQVLNLYEVASGRKVLESITVYNKDRGIRIDNGKKEVVTDAKELDEMHLNSYMFAEYAYRTGNYALELEGIERVGGTDYYKIKITSPNGRKHTNYYDKQTGYLIYVDYENTRLHLKDYQLVDGRMYCMTTHTETTTGMAYTLRVKAIHTNEKPDPALFAF